MYRSLAVAWILLAPATLAARVSVSFEGVSKELERQIRASVEIASAKDETPAATLQSLHRRAPDQIRQCLKPLGYYRADVAGELVASGSDWQARYRVTAGEPLLVTRADIVLAGAGRDDSSLGLALARFPLRPGDTLRHDRYEAGKKALVDAAAARGYLDARFDSSQMRIDLQAYTCDIVIHFQSGPRYLYGRVILDQDIVDTLLLLSAIPFKEGDSLELAGLRKLQNNLAEVPYFSQAQVELKREDADGLKIPVEVQLLPRKTQRYEFGLGYGTDTGLRGRAEVGFRRLNHRGHNATLRVEASEIERSLSAEYKVPPLFPRKALWTFGVGGGDFSPDWSSTRALRLSVTPSRPVAGWRAAVGLGYEIDAFEISVTQDTSSLLVLRTEWDRTRADDVRLPRFGSRIRLGLRGSHDAVLSSATFFEVNTEARGIVTLLPDVRLLSRGQANYTGSPAFESLPPSARHVAGGSQSVRGYDYETLGPVDEYGAQVGGQALLTGSAELDYLFVHAAGRWGIAVFADVGNAAASFESFHFESGAGAGLRWASPVGMVRLDLAWPLSQPDLSYKLHFSMGPDL
jgi:translocation and assembly module TamA